MPVMRLKGFQVYSFRSVENSGPIKTDDVGAFIGINESGKSNLLIPLWKLNPAKDGAIDPIADYPRASYNEIRAMAKKPVFIEAYFDLATDLIAELAKLTGADPKELAEVKVSRDLGGNHQVTFTKEAGPRSVAKSEVASLVKTASDEIEKLQAVDEADEKLRASVVSSLKSVHDKLRSAPEHLDSTTLNELVSSLESEDEDNEGSEHSTIAPRFAQLDDAISAIKQQVKQPGPSANEQARALILKKLPKFVYYSHYGNLDSEIYLPHVIHNMSRNDLGAKEAAKARTLKVLFDFVKLKPQEILELGQEVQNPNKDQIEASTRKKQEREILLQSASAKLTKEFREWWKQGAYVFRFSADGNHFRIWVSDDKRPEPIELESRSTGLQWFLSFFLVFLVESQDAHADSILLLDEPGLTLHALAQRDLSAFFEGLSKTNQIVFSTHSAFMIEPDKLDRVRAVYVNDAGHTVVTADLRAAAPGSVQSKSIFAAHAALGLTVSDVFLQGCQPVIVEGNSDQHYLTAMKTYLVAKGAIQPPRELVFLPGGGTRSIKAVAAIVSAKEDELPFVLLDSDANGKSLAKNLKTEAYAGQAERVVEVGEFVSEEGSEVEDLMPCKLIAEVFSREYRGAETDFTEYFDENSLIVPQMETYAAENGIELEEGWKVELAKAVKKRLLNNPSLLDDEKDLVAAWMKLFQRIVRVVEPTPEAKKRRPVRAGTESRAPSLIQ